jgi:hypothetical protein
MPLGRARKIRVEEKWEISCYLLYADVLLGDSTDVINKNTENELW